MGLRVAAGWLILPLLEAGDNKLTVFKTTGEPEKEFTGREREREKRLEEKKRKKKDGLSIVSGKGMMRLTQREIAGVRMRPVVRALQQAERGRGKHTQSRAHTHTHKTFSMSAGCGRSCVEPAASAW